MMLTGLKDPRAFLGQHAVSYSEMSTLSHCEYKWELTYNQDERPEGDTSPALELGKEMHRCLGNWWTRLDLGWKDTEHETARWLMERYNKHYFNGDMLQMEAIEVPFAVYYLGRYWFGWVDGLVRDLKTGKLWIAEFKTMGSWDKLDQLPVDKQVSLYIWALRRAGYEVEGVMYDAILTTVWTTPEGEVYKSGPKKGQEKPWHPPADSFDRRWITRTDDQLRDFEYELEAVVSLKTDLYFRTRQPIRNVGQACSYCSAMPQCYGIELELDDPF